MSSGGLVDFYCDAMDAVGRLTGDDLLDVSAKQLKKDTQYWWQRIYNRTYCGNDRTEIIRRLSALVTHVFELIDWILDSKYLQIQQGWVPHELTIEKIKVNSSYLNRFKLSLEKFQIGLKEQEQHYKKLGAAEENDFRKLHLRVDERLNRLEPTVQRLKVYIAELRDKTQSPHSQHSHSSSSSTRPKQQQSSQSDAAGESILFK